MAVILVYDSGVLLECPGKHVVNGCRDLSFGAGQGTFVSEAHNSVESMGTVNINGKLRHMYVQAEDDRW